MTFIAVLTYFTLHEVARELEDPFIHPPNVAPLSAIQKTFNKRLISTWHSLEEMYDPDAIPDEMHASVGLRGIQGSNIEELAHTWSHRHSRLKTPGGTRCRGETGGTPELTIRDSTTPVLELDKPEGLDKVALTAAVAMRWQAKATSRRSARRGSAPSLLLMGEKVVNVS
jgi:hypothetical protein|eukprot:2587019-Prymnesium_polylepis.1